MRSLFVLGALGVFLASVFAAQAASLPFPDGRYVTDASLCQMSEQEMVDRHGDMIGTMVRAIKGDHVSNAYEMSCTVSNVRIAGNNVRFRARCGREGQMETVNGRYVRVSPTSFRLGGQTFSLCMAEADAVMPAANFTESTSNDGWYGEDFRRCDGTTVDMIQCMNGLRDKWDDRLNAAYQQVMAARSEPQKSALRDAQRRWIGFRDANCLYYAEGQGSIAGIEAAMCGYRMTRDRASELETMDR